MSQASDQNPDAIKDRHWFNSIHESRIQALQAIRDAATVQNLGSRGNEAVRMKQAHSATVSFFLELEPTIQQSEYADEFLNTLNLGFIHFPELDRRFMVDGFNTYAALDNPVEIQSQEPHNGLLGIRSQNVTASKLVPLPVIVTAYRHLRAFAHQFNLTKSEREENVHGEPF